MKQQAMTLLQFQQRFSNEESCYDYLFKMKWPEGFICPRCGQKEYYQTTTRKHPLYECKSCRHQTTVTVGTIFEKTRTPLLKWFWAIYLSAHDKRGVSANFISKEIEVSYWVAWLMLQKIREAMGERDNNYLLNGIVEVDESFFGAPTEGGRRGRGTEKAMVFVELSLNQKGHPQYMKMTVIDNMKKETVIDKIKKTVVTKSEIRSDAYPSYQALSKEGYRHFSAPCDLKSNPDHLGWIHTIISNAKAFIGGTLHGLDSKHLQRYLNEFCYRFNRRMFQGEGFNRLLFSCLTTKTITYSELTQ